MQFDVYLIDPHYTEKVAICCVDDKLNYSLYSFTESNHLLIWFVWSCEYADEYAYRYRRF